MMDLSRLRANIAVFVKVVLDVNQPLRCSGLLANMHFIPLSLIYTYSNTLRFNNISQCVYVTLYVKHWSLT